MRSALTNNGPDSRPKIAVETGERTRSVVANIITGFTVKTPDAPYKSAWELTLERGRPWFGVLHISRRKGRVLRITLTWNPENRPHDTRSAEGAVAVRTLIGQAGRWGWADA